MVNDITPVGGNGEGNNKIHEATLCPACTFHSHGITPRCRHAAVVGVLEGRRRGDNMIAGPYSHQPTSRSFGGNQHWSPASPGIQSYNKSSPALRLHSQSFESGLLQPSVETCMTTKLVVGRRASRPYVLILTIGGWLTSVTRVK